MKRFAPLLAIVLLIGCTSDTADACRLRARIRAWIATRPVMSRLVVPVVPVEPGTVYVLPDLVAPPLPEVAYPVIVPPRAAVNNCPGGNCQQQSVGQPVYAPRVRLFGRWR